MSRPVYENLPHKKPGDPLPVLPTEEPVKEEVVKEEPKKSEPKKKRRGKSKWMTE